MLTATPINNWLNDFRHMVELFTRRDDAYFARTLGVNNLTAHFNTMEQGRSGAQVGDDARRSESLAEAQETPRRRRDLPRARRAAQPRLRQGEPDPGEQARPRCSRSASHPKSPSTRSARPTAGCSTWSRTAFTAEKPLFTLPIYYPLALLQGRRREHRSDRGEPAEAGRRPDPHQLPEAVREFGRRPSSCHATACCASCSPSSRSTARPRPRRSGSSAGSAQNAEMLGLRHSADDSTSGLRTRRTERRGHRAAGAARAVDDLDRDEYDVAEILAETYLDLDQIVDFFEEPEVRAAPATTSSRSWSGCSSPRSWRTRRC